MVLLLALSTGCALVLTVALGPWIGGAARSRRRATRELQALGCPLRSPEGHESDEVTLAGRIEVCSAPIDAFDGGEVAATSAFDHGQAGAAAVKTAWAEALALVTDDGERVEIGGPVEVRAGSCETMTRRELTRLASPIRSRVLAADDGAGLDPAHARSSISIRSIRAGDRVRAKGRLTFDSSDASAPDGREAEGRLRLVPPADPAAPRPVSVVIAHEEAPRVRLVPRELGRRSAASALVAACLVFLAVPWMLSLRAEVLEDRVRAGLLGYGCDTFDHETAKRAIALRAEQSRFPGWSSAAAPLVRDVIWAMQSSIQGRCSGDRADELGEFAAAWLPDLVGSNQFSRMRKQLERNWHELGRDRRIVELSRRLPEGGDVNERVRAHLYLGDLHGAAEVWREPGAFTDSTNILHTKGVLTKGNVLCMAGDYPSALEAWDEQLDALDRHYADGGRGRGREALLVRHAECLRRAGELERAERVAGDLAEIARGVSDAPYLRALIAEDRGDLDAALEALRGSDHGTRAIPRRLFLLSLLARAGDRAALLEQLTQGRLIGDLSREYDGAELYNHVFQPPRDEARLEMVGEALAGAPENSEQKLFAVWVGWNLAASAPSSARESAREVAGLFYLALALEKSRRLDPRAEDYFDRAESLRPDDEHLRRTRRLMDFFQGDWDAPNEDDEARRARRSPGVTFRELRAAYQGELVLDHEDLMRPRLSYWMPIEALNPIGLQFEIGLAQSYSMDMSPEYRLGILERQIFPATWPSIFYRLTNLIVHGEHMGFDMSERRSQLKALREMLDAQPNLILLAGIDGRDGI